MAEAKSTLVINGRDNTAGAFASVAARASACGAKMSHMLGGALAAAGAYMGWSAVKGGIDELGHLSDIATKANMSVDDLTKTSRGLNVLGIQRVGIDELAKAFDYMQKTTGRVGMAGFYQTIEELGKIEDRAKRGQEAMRIFGRTGMEFMPLINAAAAGGVSALQGVLDVMPAITQSAANSGDAVADAMSIMGDGVHSMFVRAIGAICSLLDTQFVGGVRTAALMACNWMEYYAKLGASKVAYYYGMVRNSMEEVGTGVGTFIGSLAGGASLSEAMSMTRDAYAQEREWNMNAEDEEKAALERRQAEWEKQFEARKTALAKFDENQSKAAISADGETAAAEAAAKAAKAGGNVRSTAIRNALMMAGSNEANKLAAFGPQYQQESKKQTELLKKIEQNTAKQSEAAELLDVVE